jgi:8-oxo-dGTP pyrophosphatase MutT (NUDIX family)
MKTLAIFDRKDYDITHPRFVKKSSRAIIIIDSKIALLYSDKYKIYCFPGGGIEGKETYEEALIRETKEEAGLIIIPETIKEYGMIIETRKDMKVENGIYEQQEFYYTCKVKEKIIDQNLTEAEKDAGYELKYVNFDEAISLNEIEIKIKKIYTEAETFVLRQLKNEYKVL